MSGPRQSRLLAAVALLALGLRLLVPALHDHPGRPAAPVRGPVAATHGCSCSGVHATPDAAPPRGDRAGDPRPVGAADRREEIDASTAVGHAHHCIACEVELGTPGPVADPTPSGSVAARCENLRAPASPWLGAALGGRLPPSRAPPTGGASFS